MFKGARKTNKMPSGLEIEDYVLTATEKEAARMEKPFQKKWFDVLYWLVIFLMVVLAFRVIFLNVIKGAYYREVSKGNSIRSVVMKAPRGRIFDRNNVPLVNNVPSIDAVIVPGDIPRDSAQLKKISNKVSSILGMNEAEVRIALESNMSKSFNTVLLKENISQDESLMLLEKAVELPGIGIEKTAIREYIDGAIFSHVLGYEGKIEKKELEQNKGYLLTDYIGKQGIEKSYEQHLRGVHGANQIEVDSMGNMKREVGIIHPKPGNDLILNIDSGLQKKIYDSLNAILEKTGTKTAAAVAIDPRDGGVLAVVNLPSFDNNLFAKKISGEEYSKLIQDPDKPLFNRAVSGEYPPGSTIKPIISVAALSEGVITPSTIIDGLGGVLRIGSYSFGDWKVHGPSDVRTAIAESNDIFFYTIGGGYGNIQGLGISRMKKWYNLFGLGEKTGIDIGGESEGLIPDEQWKKEKIGERWTIGNSYHASIGQGYVAATPLQLANYVVAVANGGTLYKPRIVSKIKKNSGETIELEPEIIRSGFASANFINVVKEGMRKTVTDGPAQSLKDLPVEVAGKTGTAQFGSEDKTHGWFVSFAPYDNPEIALVILSEGESDGNSSAVPATKEIYEWYFGDKN